MPRSISDLFQQWRLKCSSSSKKILRKLSIFSGVWRSWFERNSRVFRNKSATVEEVADSIICSVSNWASRDKEFEGISHHDPNRSWDGCLQKNKFHKLISNSSWMSQPKGVLKLNFDCNYLKEKCKGGYGGVIRTSNGRILVELSGPVECDDPWSVCHDHGMLRLAQDRSLQCNC